MRRFVNGDECDLDPDAAEVTQVGDRLMVHTAEGTFTAVAISIGEATLISYKGRQYRIERKATRRSGHLHSADGEMRAAMPGQVVDVAFVPGDEVKKGQTVLVLEAMKTHQPFVAPFDGMVTNVEVTKGDQVGEGQLLAVVKAA